MTAEKMDTHEKPHRCKKGYPSKLSVEEARAKRLRFLKLRKWPSNEMNIYLSGNVHNIWKG